VKELWEWENYEKAGRGCESTELGWLEGSWLVGDEFASVQSGMHEAARLVKEGNELLPLVRTGEYFPHPRDWKTPPISLSIPLIWRLYIVHTVNFFTASPSCSSLENLFLGVFLLIG
jgi:hypothetical protein